MHRLTSLDHSLDIVNERNTVAPRVVLMAPRMQSIKWVTLNFSMPLAAFSRKESEEICWVKNNFLDGLSWD